MSSSFHNETKYCPCCDGYRNYLSSIDSSYCIDCGSEVRLFSETDWAAFQTKMESKKSKGGRPRKNARRAAATAARIQRAA